MTEQPNNNQPPQNSSDAGPRGQGFDAQEMQEGYRYFSNALKVSFSLLKIIMIILVVVFVGSGFRVIGSDERALVLRFGKIRGVGEDRLLSPGQKLLFPYPVHEVIKIPTEKKFALGINTFWYYQKPGEEMIEDPTRPVYVNAELDPLIDGYCIIRGERQSNVPGGSEGSDYNIAHSKWVLTYQITNPERFYKNTFVDETKIEAGQNYGDLIEAGAKPLLRNIVADAVVTAMVNYTIKDAMSDKTATVTEHVRRLIQNKLDITQSGIKVISLQRTSFTWPRQVARAFEAALRASNAKQKTISEAKLYAEKALSETAGLVAEKLVDALQNNNLSNEQLELLWDRLAGEAQERIAQAQAYRTQVVENAKANADYVAQILPEYRKRPRLVIQKIYQDAIEQVLENVDETVIIQPTEGAKGAEIRIQISRDPTLKKKSEQQQ